MSAIKPEDLVRYLSYCPASGVITRKIATSRNVKAGDVAGTIMTIKNRKYISIALLTKYYLAHRIAWAIHYGCWPKGDIDHIDGDGLNNRIENLRDVSHKINCRNQKLRNTNTSGHIGVDFVNGRWRARIGIGGITKHIGFFDTIDSAVNARLIESIAHDYHQNHGKQ